MMYCKDCGTYHEEGHQTCTICGKKLIEKSFTDTLNLEGYPEVKVVKQKRKMAAKILAVITIAASLIVLLINAMTYDTYQELWSLIVVGALSYPWLILNQVIISKHEYPTKVLRQIFFISVILIIIDLFTVYKGWALTYVITFMLTSTTLILPIVVATEVKKYYLYVRSLFLLVVFDFIVGILPFVSNFMEKDVLWTGLMTLFSGVMLIIVMFVFARKTTWTELIKIFRI